MFERVYSDTPRILAIDDVRLHASGQLAGQLAEFYQDLLGLQPQEPAPRSDLLVFRGVNRSGARLLISLVGDPPQPPARRALLVQVGSLYALAESCRQRQWPYEWFRGWSYYDRRLLVEDPAGYRVELVTYHVL